MPNARKLLYSPGIISLTGLLVLLSCYKNKVIPKQYYKIELAVPALHNLPGLERFSVASIKRVLATKTQINLTLDSNYEMNERKFQIIAYECSKMQYTCDTNMAIVVNLTKDIMYQDLIRLIDIANYIPLKRWALLPGAIAFFGDCLKPKIETSSEIPLLTCAYAEVNAHLHKPKPQKIFPAFKNYYSVEAICLLGVLIAVAISTYYFRRRI